MYEILIFIRKHEKRKILHSTTKIKSLYWLELNNYFFEVIEYWMKSTFTGFQKLTTGTVSEITLENSLQILDLLNISNLRKVATINCLFKK